MRVKWLRAALKNLDEELGFIAKQDNELSIEIYAHLMDVVEGLKDLPNAGRPGRIFGTRELVIARYPYIIPYRVRGDVVEILRVFHTSRKLPGRW